MDHHCDSKVKDSCQASKFVSAEQQFQDHFQDIPEGASEVDEELLFEYLEEIDLETRESLRRHYHNLIRELRKGSEAMDISELPHRISASLRGHMHLNGSTMQKKRRSADEKKRCISVEKLSNKLGRFKIKTLILGEDGRRGGH